MDEKELLIKYILGILTDEEQKQLNCWIAADPAHARYVEKLRRRKNYSELYLLYKQKRQMLKLERHMRRKHWWLRAACVALPLLILLGAYWGFYSGSDASRIRPGTSRAVLYLDSVTHVELGNSKEFAWIRINKMDIAIEEQGVLDYSHHTPAVEAHISQCNMLQTPRGGEYRIVLEDGTRVHLNSLSTLTYPVCFDQDTRTVQLSGEAYFEVAKDARRPFLVKVNGLTVKQYGTRFGITARTPFHTTVALEEGTIGVTAPGSSERILSVGDVAVWNDSLSLLTVVSPASLESYTAWHYSRFVFENKTLGDIMQTLSLWYNVEVQFEDKALSALHFTGSVGRYDDIRIILDVIEEAAAVRFRIKGDRILIMNK